MESLFALLVLASLILFLIGIFSPETSLFWDKKQRTRKKSALIYGGLLFLFFILFGSVIDKSKLNNDETNHIGEFQAKEKSNAQSTTDPTTDAQTFSRRNDNSIQGLVGQSYDLGTISYKIERTKFKKFIGGAYTLNKADGIFLIISLTVTNKGQNQIIIDNSYFQLADESGAVYEYSPDATATLEVSGVGGETFWGMTINPHVSKKAKVIFELPTKNKNYKLIFNDPFSEKSLEVYMND